MASETLETLSPEINNMSGVYDNFVPNTLEMLTQMGFPKERGEKAIAATGDRGVQLSSDWLLSHCNDPNLDDGLPREYILYLCPIGPFQAHLSSFWQKSLEICGWNGSHSYFPHITLCPFFVAPDSKVTALSEAFSKLASKLKNSPGKLILDFFSQMNFIGLFVGEAYYNFLTNVITDFANDLKKHGINVEYGKKQLHMTLAYQYPPDHHEKLVTIAKEINLFSDVRWDLRLFSRDSKISKCLVRKVNRGYKPRTAEELELIDGDFVFIDPEEMHKGKNSAYFGTSWLTGNIGLFPSYYTQRTAETWTWTLHRSLPLSEKPPEAIVENGVSEEPQETYEDLWRDEREELYAKVVKKNRRESVVPPPVGPCCVYVMRHGERVDGVFGKQWVNRCFDQSGHYVRFDLNMPKSIHLRKANREYYGDPPLTPIGIVQAKMTGAGLLDRGVVVQQVYCSPSLRCIQTAMAVMKSLQYQGMLRIELGLFEWLGWHQLGIPKFLPNNELLELGYNIDIAYKPHYTMEKLNPSETVEDYYRRSGLVVKNIVKNHEHQGGGILIVAHAGSLDVCAGQLMGRPPRKSQEFRSHVCKIPYCALCCVEKNPVTKQWALKDPPVIPTMTHGPTKVTDWFEQLKSA
ncbi:hypothetical protein ScPMuIL_005374 [Solemya velum]